MGGCEDEFLVFNDIVDYISELMDDEFEVLFVMGLGFIVN